jgi:DNA-binding IclR family transcriptional regulator
VNSRAAEGTAALDKALDVLDAVGQAPAGLSQAELGAKLALPRTTLYRLLGTLVARGLLRRDPLRRVYCLGMRCFEYARKAFAMPDLVAAAGIELRALRDMTGETTYLATLDGLEVISLERCDGAHGERSRSALGQRKPLHCTSQGKAILAALPQEQRDAIVKELPMTAVTPRSITDRRRLQAELRLTAQRGWSIDDEEIAPGVRCCGAAIVDAQGQVRGSISVAGPAFRLTHERVELIGPEVVEAARRIGAQLSATQAALPEGEVRVVPGEWAFDGAFPCWSAQAEGGLWWADALAPAVHLASAEGDRIVTALDAPIDGLLLHAGGAAVLAGGAWQAVAPDGSLRGLPGWPRRRIAALCAGPDGALWGCIADGEGWRVAALSAEGQALGGWRLAEPATALAWDAAGRRLYVACAESGTLQVAAVGSTALRRLATVPKGSGRLGGLAVDERGGIWSTLRGGWSVVRFEPDGTVSQVVALPVPAPTDLGFGGADARTLYITSARETVTREALEAAPLSGRLFVLETPVPGVRARPLA